MLYVGSIDVNNLDARDALNFITTSQGLEYTIQEITEEEFNRLLTQYDDAGMSIGETLEQLEEEHDVTFGIDDNEESAAGIGDEIKDEAPLLKLFRKVLAEAVKERASDIHIEAHEKHSAVRFRVDGVLREQFPFTKKLHDAVVAIIKLKTGTMRTDERRRPQDGRFGVRMSGGRVDFRVATFPTVYGEKVILRVLDRQRGIMPLSDLGLSEEAEKKMKNASKNRHGIILVTGPTGSGKTTTLYSLLNTLDRTSSNIVSLEDPVEYQLDGVNQSNIRPELDYDFKSGLRSVLRGDPDQILVGEIRDTETARLAVQAALTGHLVYSTLHTNTAVGAITRLLDFGIEPFLLSPVIRLVVNQITLRRIEGEGKEKLISDTMRKYFEDKFADLPAKYRKSIPPFSSFRDPLPTADSPTGLKGRVGVFELLEVDEDIQSLILNNPSEKEIFTVARKKGYMTLTESAIIKGLEGVIPFEEIVRVGNEDALNKAGIDINEPDTVSQSGTPLDEISQQPAMDPDTPSDISDLSFSNNPKTPTA